MVKRLALAALLALVLSPALNLAANQAASPVFVVTFAKSAHPAPVTGQVYVAISRTNDRQTPIRQTGPTGAPLFSVPVRQLAPEAEVRFSPQTEGYPVAALKDLPPGEY
jgi:hypothetical protein